MNNLKVRNAPSTTVNMMPKTVPKVYISQSAADKMFLYIKHCKQEIGWLCSVQDLEDNTYYIKDTHLFEQQVHATTCELSADALSDFGTKLIIDDPVTGMDTWNSIRAWGHSHVNMQVNPSGQDTLQMNTFKGEGVNYFIRLIGNKSGELKIDFFNYATGFVFIDVPWQIIESEAVFELRQQVIKLEEEIAHLQKEQVEAISASILAEVNAKAKPFVYNYAKNNVTAYDYYKDYNGYGKKNTAVKTNAVKNFPIKEVKILLPDDKIEEIGGMATFAMANVELTKLLKYYSYYDKYNIYETCCEYVDKLILEHAEKVGNV